MADIKQISVGGKVYNVSGDATAVLPVSMGGTGASDAETARANIGAAPSGYGLGVRDVWLGDDSDIDTISQNGWYCLARENTSPNKPFDYSSIFTMDIASATSQVQIGNNRASTRPILKIRKQQGGVWSEWAWVNPPMELGVEYCTIEQYRGKPVYCLAYDFGAMPNASSASITITGFGIKGVISLSGIMSDGRPVPYETTNSTWGSVYIYANAPTAAGGLGISVRTTSDLSSKTLVLLLKYLKDTV